MKSITAFLKKLFKRSRQFSGFNYKPMWAKVPVDAMTKPYGSAIMQGKKHKVTILHPKYRPTTAEVTTKTIVALRTNGCEVMY